MNDAPPLLSGISQIALGSADPGALAAWYRDVLGLAVLFEAGGMTFMQSGATRLMIGPNHHGATIGGDTVIYFEPRDWSAAESALEAKGIDLPGPLRGIPAVIRQAARQVRAARTIQEARAAVGSAVAEVRKAIALLRADDPSIGRLQIQRANRIASALGSVESRLSRATGL